MRSLTKIAKTYGKRVDNWMRLKSTQDLILRSGGSINAFKGYAALGDGRTGYGETLASDEIADAFEAWCQKDSQSKPNQVYFIRGDKTNSFKVGISSDPRARLKAMQIGSPIKLLLTRAVEVQNPESVEKELHSVFAKYRIHGEWFSMPWKDAVEIFDSIIKNHEVTGH